MGRLHGALFQRALEPSMEATERQRGHLLHRAIGDARASGQVGEWREGYARAAGRRRRELPAPVDGRSLGRM